MAFAPMAFLIVVLLVSLGLPILFVAPSLYFPLEATEFIYLAGRYFALAAFLIITFQYLWTAKIKPLERIRSYDGRVAVHRTLGFLGVLVLGLHPILILVFYATNGISIYIDLAMGLGFLSLILLLVVVGATFLGRIWRVRYEVWKRVHWLTFPVLTLAFFHSLFLGSDIYGGFRTVWFIVWGFHLGTVLWKLAHKVRVWSRTVKIESVTEATPGITTIQMENPNASYLPGQFAFLSLKLGKKWEAWHPFSLTSDPSDSSLTMSIKGIGDFSTGVAQVSPGDRAKIDPGYGAFSTSIVQDKRYVLIAGGVGVTPIRGIIQSLVSRDPAPEVVLIQCAHHETDLLFRDEFEQIFSARPNWRLHLVCTSQPDWEGERGRLTPEVVHRLCAEDLDATFFLCGPYPMVKSIAGYLRSKGVRKRKIRREQFVFLP